MLDQVLIPMEYPLATTFGLDPNEVDPKITVRGFQIPDPATLGDPQLQAYAAYLRANVPPVDPDYVFRKDIVRAIYYWWKMGDNGIFDVLALYGPTGSGKTSVISEFCARIGVPLLSCKGHKGFEPYEAFGLYVMGEGGTTSWAPGPVTMAAQYGLPVVINEYDRLQASRAIVFNDVFEGRAFPVPGKHGEMIVPRPGFRCIATMNTNMVEDPSGNYGTAASQDISLLERCYGVEVPYPEEAVEAEVLGKVLAPYDDQFLAYWFDQEEMKLNTPNGLKEGGAISRGEFITGLIKVANEIRKLSKDGGNQSDSALERTMSTRILRKWALHSANHFSAPEKRGLSALHLTLKMYLSAFATESTRIALHEVVKAVFGVEEKVG